MSPTTTAKTRSTAAKTAANTRAANARRRSAAAKRAAATRKVNEANLRTPVEQVQEYAEKAVLIPVGAALVARDRVVETVSELTKTYSDPETAQKRIERNVKRFERRGSTARNRVERQVKRTRTRVERELRQRRTRVERQAKAAQRSVSRRANLVSSQVDSTVAAGQKAVADVQERVASVA